MNEDEKTLLLLKSHRQVISHLRARAQAVKVIDRKSLPLHLGPEFRDLLPQLAHRSQARRIAAGREKI